MTEEPSSQFPYTVGALFNIHADVSSGITDAHLSGQSPSRLLTITGTILTGRARYTQLVLCQVSPAITQNGTEALVAKIWDTMYYPEPQGKRKRSPIEQATLEYNKETAAFKRIAAGEPSAPRRCTPDYYGSWSLQCPETIASSASQSTRARQKQKDPLSVRTIPLVLMEYVPGCSMMSLATRKTSLCYQAIELCAEDYRLAAWARVLEIESWLDHIGVDHADIEMRNFIIDPAPKLPDSPTAGKTKSLITLEQSKPRRVTIIDFDLSRLNPASPESQPRNPIDKHWSGDYAPLGSWLPRWWRYDLPKRRKWLLEHFEDSTYYRSVPPHKSREKTEVFSEEDLEHLKRWYS